MKSLSQYPHLWLLFSVLWLLVINASACTSASPTVGIVPTPVAQATATPAWQPPGPYPLGYTPPPPPTAVPVTRTPLPSVVPSATLLPTPKPFAYTTPDPSLAPFARELKRALEQNDDAALRRLIGVPFSLASWRAGPGQAETVDDAWARWRAVRNGATLTVDLERPVIDEWAGVPENVPGVHRLFVRWLASDLREDFAELTVKRANGEWRWVGVYTHVPFYHSPSLTQLRENPMLYVMRHGYRGPAELMFVGEYRGQVSIHPQGQSDGFDAFVLRDLSGTSIWVSMSGTGIPFPLDRGDPRSTGRLVRVIGMVRGQNGVPYLVSDAVTLVDENTYAELSGTLEVQAERSLSLLTSGGARQSVRLYETTAFDLADGNPAPTPLPKGTRVRVIGTRTPNQDVFAEHVYVLP